MTRFVRRMLAAVMCLAVCQGIVRAEEILPWDNGSDTWVATDGLGRRLPVFPAVPSPRRDRWVGMFYFLWHGAHIQGGPYDISRILQEDPDAMSKPDSPLWGPLHVPHHWGRSVFDYYRTADAGVLRKHAQLLSDAGVDFVVFDVTNQVTYRDDYRALLATWDAWRRLGNRCPRVAFLTPFWAPGKVVQELWRDLYSRGDFRELWFEWQGKPLLLADAELLGEATTFAAKNVPQELQPGHSLGQSLVADRPLRSIAGQFPTWRGRSAAVTLTLHREGPGGERVKSERFFNLSDNAWVQLTWDPPLPPGRYYLEATEPGEHVGWWSHSDDGIPGGSAFADGNRVPGGRTLRLGLVDEATERIRDFFTFRKPQPDYFQGQTHPDMWSWLEVAPQHVFTNRAGVREQMSVGVAQNAVQGRLGSMSEAGAHGRSFHGGRTETTPGAVNRGLNFEEQWRHALKEDPQVIFVTGWNEWIAGRFKEFNGVRKPVMFVDQFDQEHSRDIEPMVGGHADNYYYQLVAKIREFKGARRPMPAVAQPIAIDGSFTDWDKIAPEFRDSVGDPVHRDHRGWGAGIQYTNHTGRNDLRRAKISWDAQFLQFYVQANAPLTPATDSRWMILYIDSDANVATGWMGYDWVVNRFRGGGGQCSIEKNVGNGYRWERVGEGSMGMAGSELELQVRRSILWPKARGSTVEFKWADNVQETGAWSDFTVNGDVAPNDRFNYRAEIP